MTSDQEAVLSAARRRGGALASGVPSALAALHHPELRWTTHRGDLLTRDTYVAGNTGDGLVWHGQQLEDAEVVIVGNTAVLTAVAVDEVAGGTFRMRLTLTWVRRSGEWLLLAGHAGPLIG